jgi:hypothetical protein
MWGRFRDLQAGLARGARRRPGRGLGRGGGILGRATGRRRGVRRRGLGKPFRSALRGARRGRCRRGGRGEGRLIGRGRAECQRIGAKRCLRGCLAPEASARRRGARRRFGGRRRRPDRPRQKLRNQQHEKRHQDDGARQSLFHPAEYTPSHSSAGPTVCTEPHTTMRSPGRAAARAAAQASATEPARTGSRATPCRRRASSAAPMPRGPCRSQRNQRCTAGASAAPMAGASLSPRMPTTAKVLP